MRPEHRLPTAIITLILLGQAAATATGVAVKVAGDGYWEDSAWPFMDYPMYSAAHGPPVQTSTATLFAKLPDGTDLAITPEFMGIAFFEWRYQIVERIGVGEITERHAHLAEGIEADRVEALGRVLEQVRQAVGVVPVAVRIDRRTHTITDAGLVVEDIPQRVAVPADPSASRDLTEPTQ